jgi:hypothetical protein
MDACGRQRARVLRPPPREAREGEVRVVDDERCPARDGRVARGGPTMTQPACDCASCDW